MKTNHSVGKSRETRICGIKAECLSHICQDAIHFNRFMDSKGQEVSVGSISDGCSGVFGSENGSEFLVRAFAEEAERLGKSGQRDERYLRQVSLALLKRMARYEPLNPESSVFSVNGNTFSDELFATLYGFVADKEKVLMLLAGDGFLAINGYGLEITQEGGDLYPINLLKLPEDKWEEKLDDLFEFVEIPTERINDFVLATDGFSQPRLEEHPGITRNPAMFILQAHFHATKDDLDGIPGANASRGHDDATALAYARIGSVAHHQISFKEVAEICNRATYHRTRHSDASLADERVVSTKSSIKKCAAQNDPGFKRRITGSNGIHLYGITHEDQTEYKRKKDRINSSRIAYTNDANPFSFIDSVGRSALPKKPTLSPVARNKPALPISRKNRTQGKASFIKESFAAPEQLKTAPKPKTKKPVEGTTQKDRTEIWIPFENLCDYRLSMKLGVGFRHFPFIADDLWKFIQDKHDGGWRIGNLRPQDLESNIRRLRSNEPEFKFRLRDCSTMAKIDSHDKSNLVQPYGRMDEQFIHPRFIDRLANDDEARLDHDWYSYKTLLFWVFIKADPFGLGAVKGMTSVDRLYRMENEIYSVDKEIEKEEREKIFIKRGFDRLGTKIQTFLLGTLSSIDLRENPQIIKFVFMQEAVKCQKCNFSQLSRFIPCGFCNFMEIKIL